MVELVSLTALKTMGTVPCCEFEQLDISSPVSDGHDIFTRTDCLGRLAARVLEGQHRRSALSYQLT